MLLILFIALGILMPSGCLLSTAYAQQDPIRVKVEVVAVANLDQQAERHLDNAFGKLPDIQLVEESPEIYIHVIVRRLVTNRGRRLGYVIASASSEILNIPLEDNPLICSNYYGLWLETGPDLGNLCYQCVEAMNAGVFEGLREQTSAQLEEPITDEFIDQDF
ncbi:MAG: hypothetical protein GF409_08565 [Candidatus Omnitrophica bacterium]|nr:hypothetical protein [Candidatus Omnitrophota bacterium]